MTKLTDSDLAIFYEVYPLLKEIEDRLNQSIALSLWANLTRKLAVRGIPKDRLHQLLDEHYDHQADYERQHAH
jgi:hypothetical protein